MPASAGPIARAMLTLTAARAEADGNCSRGTSSGTIDWYVGTVIAAPQPSPKVSVSSSAGVICPATVRTVSSTPTANW